MKIVYWIYNFLWGDLLEIPLPGGNTVALSLLVLILVPAGIFFMIRTRFLPIRLFPDMLKITVSTEKKSDGLSGLQALIVSTATRVGMGNLVGVVAAVSAGGAGAVFWMWVTAIVGSATAFIEATLAVLFAISGLLCWCGISQVIGNSVSTSLQNAFHIPTLWTAVALTIVSAVIVLRKNATVKVLDVVVPIMAGCYFFVTVFIILKNVGQLPAIFERIFAEAFGIRQVAAGSFGTVIMNGVKRGLFSNEAGSGSAPCAAAAADIDHPTKEGLLQALGVFIDTLVICSCSAMLMLLAPEESISGLAGMDLLQSAMEYHMGQVGVVFIAVMLLLFSFSTFIGILFYARSNVAYLFGDNWLSQTLYKILALVMLFIGCQAAYTFVWDLGDVGIGLMTIFNMIALFPLSKEALASLKDYETKKKKGELSL